MRKFFYARLAADNLKKNRQTYLPYLISCSITCAMIYIICSLSMNEGLSKMAAGATSTPIVLRFGTYIAMFFAAIFLFYTNSFLMKHRRKEFGLYQLLGMEKRHLARVLLLETFYTALITTVCGFLLGILLDKLMFLLLLRIIGIVSAKVPFGFHICGKAILLVAAFFGIVFILILLNAVRIVHFTKPVNMLSGANAGEREPKTKLIMAILGVILVGAGYIMSICAKDTGLILKFMLPAVLDVIVGTYFLFIAGSIALLKLLKRNKSFYYKTRHFTAISGMIYRMKQNAVGLSTICILSTMVLVLISSTSCMLLGAKDMIGEMFPREITTTGMPQQDGSITFIDNIDRHLESFGLHAENPVTYAQVGAGAIFSDGKFNEPDYSNPRQREQMQTLTVICSDHYTDITGEEIALEPDEILLSSTEKLPTLRQQTELFGVKFRIKQLIKPVHGINSFTAGYVAVVSDLDALKKLEIIGQRYIMYNYAFDIPADREIEVFGDMEQRYGKSNLTNELGVMMLGMRNEEYTMYMSIFGGFFFIALFLGLLFMLQMVLMIYYKQLSEGHDDRRRYIIMQNVGMSLHEVRQTIRSQILTVFFLPLVTAAIHTAFCIPIITRVLSEMELTNNSLIYLILGGTFVAFSLIYALIYALTAKTYYRIVSTNAAHA